MGSQCSFWRWYSSGLRTLILFRWLRHPAAEYVVGIAVFVFGSVAVALYGPLLLLLVTIPVGSTIAAHGMWRGRLQWE